LFILYTSLFPVNCAIYMLVEAMLRVENVLQSCAKSIHRGMWAICFISMVWTYTYWAAHFQWREQNIPPSEWTPHPDFVPIQGCTIYGEYLPHPGSYHTNNSRTHKRLPHITEHRLNQHAPLSRKTPWDFTHVIILSFIKIF